MSHTTFRARAACAILAFAAVLGGCASRPETPGGLARDDRTVAMQAAGAGLYEVAAARLATSRTAAAGVRAYADMLVQHHGASHAELGSLLAARGVAVPAVLPPQFDARLAALAGVPAPRFDAQFVQLTGVQDHQAQITLFEHASRTVQDPALRGWFARQLPVLRQHLQAAQDLARAP
jgi:putative membrane protein